MLNYLVLCLLSAYLTNTFDELKLRFAQNAEIFFMCVFLSVFTPTIAAFGYVCR